MAFVTQSHSESQTDLEVSVMKHGSKKQREALKEARAAMLASRAQYIDEVPIATKPINASTTAPSLPSVERQAELMANIAFAQRKYDDTLRAEGRPVPHRPT
jgi:hypothetical protein